MHFNDDETLAIAHFGELWLKGHNRNEYINLLERNVKEQLYGESYVLNRQYDRLILRFTDDSETESIKSKLAKTFGLSGYEIAKTTAPKVAKITALARSMLKSRKNARCVKINSHRSDKTLPFNSIDVIDKVRREVEKLGMTPDTKQYDTELNISITKSAAFLSLEREKGPGGLPVGSSGRGVVLLSGGIDSPVAAFYAMKRGLAPVYVHVHAFQSRAWRALHACEAHGKLFQAPQGTRRFG